MIFFVFSTGVIRNFLACLSKFSVFIRNWSACFEKASFLYADSYGIHIYIYIYIYAIIKKNYQKRVKDFISTTFLIP